MILSKSSQNTKLFKIIEFINKKSTNVLPLNVIVSHYNKNVIQTIQKPYQINSHLNCSLIKY
jgi:hypothetical protein